MIIFIFASDRENIIRIDYKVADPLPESHRHQSCEPGLLAYSLSN